MLISVLVSALPCQQWCLHGHSTLPFVYHLPWLCSTGYCVLSWFPEHHTLLFCLLFPIFSLSFVISVSVSFSSIAVSQGFVLCPFIFSLSLLPPGTPIQSWGLNYCVCVHAPSLPIFIPSSNFWIEPQTSASWSLVTCLSQHHLKLNISKLTLSLNLLQA